MAFGAQIQDLAQRHSSGFEEDVVVDENLEIAFDRLVDALESLPEEMQSLPVNDPLVQAYLQQTLSGSQDGITPRSWIGLAKCTARLGGGCRNYGFAGWKVWMRCIFARRGP